MRGGFHPGIGQTQTCLSFSKVAALLLYTTWLFKGTGPSISSLAEHILGMPEVPGAIPQHLQLKLLRQNVMCKTLEVSVSGVNPQADAGVCLRGFLPAEHMPNSSPVRPGMWDWLFTSLAQNRQVDRLRERQCPDETLGSRQQ